jgi:methionyl-tRNA synthetase
MSQRILVTAALPYANGAIHLGHLVEYCQADMYVRALKRQGEDAVFICADDTHGTPIEINAQKQGVEPADLVSRFHQEHVRSFARFDVAFDHFSTTDSEANREVVERAYSELRQRGALDDRDLDGNWCPTDERFLPDRYIKGTCPNCGAPDQYGDVCEVCGKTYAPTDLKDPRCVLCGNPPVIKKSKHVFFRLSDPEVVAFLRRWVDSGPLPLDTANYVRSWLDAGLRDWCISRDGPYFGFPIPDRPGKYFYVWLDAPLGYVGSSIEWGKEHGVGFDELWRSPDKNRIEHFIGKDIVYFHTLFWPALLERVGYTLPSKIHVHGMLTINGEKMSKSRGTFINASTFVDYVEPQALRYYYACKYGADTSDLDLSLDDFVQRVNAELVNKHANLFSRTSQFAAQKLGGRLGDLPFTPAQAQEPPEEGAAPTLLELARRVVAACRRVEGLYRRRELGLVVRELAAVADIGNELMQSEKPWDQLKTDAEAARRTITFVANVCHALAMYLWPIVPRFCEAGARVLNVRLERMDARLLFGERNRALGEFERLFERIEPKQIEAIIEASKEEAPPRHPGAPADKEQTSEPASATPIQSSPASKGSAGGGGKPLIDYETFSRLDLRVGVVLKAEAVPKSKKLVRLEVDLGEGTPRQVVAGIGQAYDPPALVGTRVVIVANLKPAKLMGLESRGMVLAAGESPALSLLRLERELPAGTEVK